MTSSSRGGKRPEPSITERLKAEIDDPCWFEPVTDTVYRTLVDALAHIKQIESRPRYRMAIKVIHHQMSGREGEATIVSIEDPAGEWVKA